MIDFRAFKEITIPEGAVKKITDASGAVLWEKSITFYIQTTHGTFNATVPSGSTWREAAAIYNESASPTNPYRISVGDYSVSIEYYYSGARAAQIQYAMPDQTIEADNVYKAT